MDSTLLRMVGIHKRFGSVLALEDVNLTLRRGEVLGLIGDNGAGKSTLMKILSGAYARDKGEIYIDGIKVKINDPSDARKEGIRMVYQELELAPNIDVPGNIFLGREFKKRLVGLIPMIDRSSMKKQAEVALMELGISIPEISKPAGQLSGGQQQAVAVARAAWAENTKVLIMDEPVSNLGVTETKEVLDLIVRLKEERHLGIIMIDHNMENIFSVADRVMVLRGGVKVGDLAIEEADPDELTKLMVGAELAAAAKKAREKRQES